jgi:hypothetical protein
MKKIGAFGLFGLLLFLIYAIDFWGFGVNDLVRRAPLRLLWVAVLDAAVLYIVLTRVRGAGWGLVWRLALVYFGVKTAVIVVETVYLPEALPRDWVPGLLVNGGVTALLAAGTAVWVNGRWSGDAHTPGFAPPALRWRRWPLLGVVWMLLFVAVGLLVFQPIARAIDAAAAEAYLAAFTPENPLLILAFQVGRGLLWVLFAIPFLQWLRGSVWQRGLALGLLFAGLMGGAQMQGIDYLPAAIWPAHLVEVVVENMLFGLVVGGTAVARKFNPVYSVAPISISADFDL